MCFVTSARPSSTATLSLAEGFARPIETTIQTVRPVKRDGTARCAIAPSVGWTRRNVLLMGGWCAKRAGRGKTARNVLRTGTVGPTARRAVVGPAPVPSDVTLIVWTWRAWFVTVRVCWNSPLSLRPCGTQRKNTSNSNVSLSWSGLSWGGFYLPLFYIGPLSLGIGFRLACRNSISF